MRRCLLLLTFVLAATVAASPVYSEAPSLNSLIPKINSYVSQQLATSLYGWTKDQRTAQLAKLKKKYAGDVKRLKKLAAEGNATAKKVEEALSRFQANLPNCAKCEHSYRGLEIDLATFEECKDKYCKPLNAAWEDIASIARSAKKK